MARAMPSPWSLDSWASVPKIDGRAPVIRFLNATDKNRGYTNLTSSTFSHPL
jgi:hypothetical protein